MSHQRPSHKERYSLESRKEEYTKMMFHLLYFIHHCAYPLFLLITFSVQSTRMPDRIPIVCERDPACSLPGFFLFPSFLHHCSSNSSRSRTKKVNSPHHSFLQIPSFPLSFHFISSLSPFFPAINLGARFLIKDDLTFGELSFIIKQTLHVFPFCFIYIQVLLLPPLDTIWFGTQPLYW